jgi:hypothetical protein
MDSTVDLFGTAGHSRHVRVYVDETKPDRHTTWQYIGLVIVDEHAVPTLVQQLIDDRGPWDGEVHFKDLGQRHQADTAHRWLQRAIRPQTPTVRFHVLGIDHGRLQRSWFGDTATDRDNNVYKRFFRSAVSYAVKSLVPGVVTVTQIVHDRAHVEEDEMFRWHTIWRMRRDHDLDFSTTRIRFLDSDHRKPDGHAVHSHVLQLADLIVGATRQCLDATTTRPYPNEVARGFLPLVQRLAHEKRCRNKNSNYGYHGRCSVSFFPLHALSLEQLDSPEERARRSFYVTRRPMMLNVAQESFGF